MKNVCGMALLLVLMVTLVISQAVLTMYAYTHILVKTSSALSRRHQDFYNLESAINLFLKQRGVRLSGGSGRFLYAGHKYHYRIADAGEYDCLMINIGGTKYASHHWLVSMYAIDLPDMVIYIRFASIGVESKCVQEHFKFISTGILSWRMSVE